jgi:hypothetical protein
MPERFGANPLEILAGTGGFEPPNGGIKIRCLTTWLRPIEERTSYTLFQAAARIGRCLPRKTLPNPGAAAGGVKIRQTRLALYGASGYKAASRFGRTRQSKRFSNTSRAL